MFRMWHTFVNDLSIPVQVEELKSYLFANQAVESQLFLHSITRVDHQTVISWAEGSQAGGQGVTLQHKYKLIRPVTVKNKQPNMSYFILDLVTLFMTTSHFHILCFCSDTTLTQHLK